MEKEQLITNARILNDKEAMALRAGNLFKTLSNMDTFDGSPLKFGTYIKTKNCFSRKIVEKDTHSGAQFIRFVQLNNDVLHFA
jgi:hypothetical protein